MDIRGDRDHRARDGLGPGSWFDSQTVVLGSMVPSVMVRRVDHRYNMSSTNMSSCRPGKRDRRQCTSCKGVYYLLLTFL